MRFSGDGGLVYTASTDESILAVDAATGKATARKKDAHDSAINRLATTGATGLASGAWGGWLLLLLPRLPAAAAASLYSWPWLCCAQACELCVLCILAQATTTAW